MLPQDIVPPSIASAPAPAWYKRSFPHRRPILIGVSLLFIVGGAVNDGLTAWFFALPFLYLLFTLLPWTKYVKILACSVIFALMVLCSHFSWGSQIVYPIIGEKILFQEDAATIAYTDNHLLNYDEYPEQKTRGLEEYVESRGIIPKGTVAHVKRIDQGTKDLGAYPIVVISDGAKEIHIREHSVASFCTKVEWEFCINKKITPTSADPMHPIFRAFASLMWYPVAPLLILTIPKYFVQGQ